MAKTCSTLSQFQRSKWKRIDIEWIKDGQKMDKKYPKVYENKQKTNTKWNKALQNCTKRTKIFEKMNKLTQMNQIVFVSSLFDQMIVVSRL